MTLDLKIYRAIFQRIFNATCPSEDLDYYRKAFHKVIEATTPEHREARAESIIPHIRGILAEEGIGQSLRDHSPLTEKGIIPIGKMFSEQQATEIVSYLRTRPVYNRHVWGISDKVGRTIEETKAIFPQASYQLSDTLFAPFITDTILSDYILNIVEQYLGCTPTLYSANFMWSFPNATSQYIGTQNYHRDLDNFRFVTLFIFMTDTNHDYTGAHQHIQGTHISSKTGDVLTIKGRAGEAFISDPFALHRGMPTLKGERLIFWARYGLYDNGYSADVTPFPLKLDMRGDRKLRYIVRPLIETEFTSPSPEAITV